MRNTFLFLIAFLTIAVMLLATEWRNMPDYQAYQRPPMEMQK